MDSDLSAILVAFAIVALLVLAVLCFLSWLVILCLGVLMGGPEATAKNIITLTVLLFLLWIIFGR